MEGKRGEATRRGMSSLLDPVTELAEFSLFLQDLRIIHSLPAPLCPKLSPNITGASWKLILLLCPCHRIIWVLIIPFHTLMHGTALPLQKVHRKPTNSHHFVRVVDYPVGLGTCVEAPLALLLSP